MNNSNMKVVRGDLIQIACDGKLDVIIHGCNCFCTMGAGIARAIATEFPEALEADKQTKSGDIKKLGNFSKATISRKEHLITIINGYTQYHFAGQKVLVDYEAIRKVFSKVKKTFTGKRIGYPKIGAGLGGGDWKQIEKIINEELSGEDHTLVLFGK